MALADLKAPPDSVAPAAAAIDRLDDALVTGFGRLSSAHLEGLAALQRAFAATPLGGELATAIQSLARSEFVDRHFLVLAAARCALQGAMHDALLAQAAAALGRPAPTIEAIAPAANQAAAPQVAVWMESARQWLMELALAGFANLDVAVILPFQATLDAIEGEPALARHAALLAGLMGELLEVFPTRGTPEVPRLPSPSPPARSAASSASSAPTSALTTPSPPSSSTASSARPAPRSRASSAPSSPPSRST